MLVVVNPVLGACRVTTHQINGFTISNLKHMATIRIFLGIICLAAFGSRGLPGSGTVTEPGFSGERLRARRLAPGVERAAGNDQSESGQKSLIGGHDFSLNGRGKSLSGCGKEATLLLIARKELDVREETVHNDGTRVEEYLRYAGAQKGDPWCAAFVSWVFGQAGYARPKTAWSPALFPKARQTINPLPADVFGIYFPNLKRIGHCGLVSKKQGNWIYTIEGNTNVAGSREGDGVYAKIRHRHSIAVFAGWLSDPKKHPSLL